MEEFFGGFFHDAITQIWYSDVSILRGDCHSLNMEIFLKWSQICRRPRSATQLGPMLPGTSDHVHVHEKLFVD